MTNMRGLVLTLALAVGTLAGVAHAYEPGNYNCSANDYENNIRTSPHIIIARLENYERPDSGKYKVLMTLRGDLTPGVVFRARTNPLPEGYEGPLEALGSRVDPLGYNFVFLADNYQRIDKEIVLNFRECAGKYGGNPSGKVVDPIQRQTIDPIINYILEK